jgi:hypothetical protein
MRSRAPLENGAWDDIVGTCDKDAGPNNQRLYLNSVRVLAGAGVVVCLMA